MKLMNALYLGVYPAMPIDLRRRVVFSNLVCWVVGLLLGVYIAIVLPRVIENGLPTLVSWVPFLIFSLAALCLFFNHLKWYLLARVLLPLGWLLLVVVLPVVVTGPRPATYFHHVYYSILFSPVVHLLFSYKKERAFFLFFLVAFFLLTVFSIDFQLAFDRSANPAVPLVSSTFGLRFFHFIFWLFLNLIMMYVLRINEKLYTELEEKNRLIFDQNQELGLQRQRLRESNEELEKRVFDRTKDLEEQNKRLTEYAFMHAHVLRAPISRIRGLMHLLPLTKDESEEKKIRLMLTESMTELEEAVRTISEKLEEAPKTNLPPD